MHPVFFRSLACVPDLEMVDDRRLRLTGKDGRTMTVDRRPEGDIVVTDGSARPRARLSVGRGRPPEILDAAARLLRAGLWEKTAPLEPGIELGQALGGIRLRLVHRDGETARLVAHGTAVTSDGHHTIEIFEGWALGITDVAVPDGVDVARWFWDVWNPARPDPFITSLSDPAVTRALVGWVEGGEAAFRTMAAGLLADAGLRGTVRLRLPSKAGETVTLRGRPDLEDALTRLFLGCGRPGRALKPRNGHDPKACRAGAHLSPASLVLSIP
jgi:hypothetical protein